MMFSKTLVVDLITVILFLVAAGITGMGIRAVVKGEVKTGGGRFHPIRTIFRSSNPIQFWTEIGLYVGVAIFFVLLGLLFSGHAPDWFHQMISERRHR